MYLKKKRLGEESKIRVTFEKVMDDLLLISIDKQQREAALLCYWRLTDVAGIPPLQIGIDCESGSLDSITFFVDKAHMLAQGPLNAAPKRGSVLLDASIFSRVNQYVDVERGYAVQVGKDLMLCLFDGEEKSQSSYQTDRLTVFLSREEEVVGFALCDLTREEMSMLQCKMDPFFRDRLSQEVPYYLQDLIENYHFSVMRIDERTTALLSPDRSFALVVTITISHVAFTYISRERGGEGKLLDYFARDMFMKKFDADDYKVRLPRGDLERQFVNSLLLLNRGMQSKWPHVLEGDRSWFAELAAYGPGYIKKPYDDVREALEPYLI